MRQPQARTPPPPEPIHLIYKSGANFNRVRTALSTSPIHPNILAVISYIGVNDKHCDPEKTSQEILPKIFVGSSTWSFPMPTYSFPRLHISLSGTQVTPVPRHQPSPPSESHHCLHSSKQTLQWHSHSLCTRSHPTNLFRLHGHPHLSHISDQTVHLLACTSSHQTHLIVSTPSHIHAWFPPQAQ